MGQVNLSCNPVYVLGPSNINISDSRGAYTVGPNSKSINSVHCFEVQLGSCDFLVLHVCWWRLGGPWHILGSQILLGLKMH